MVSPSVYVALAIQATTRSPSPPRYSLLAAYPTPSAPAHRRSYCLNKSTGTSVPVLRANISHPNTLPLVSRILPRVRSPRQPDSLARGDDKTRSCFALLSYLVMPCGPDALSCPDSCPNASGKSLMRKCTGSLRRKHANSFLLLGGAVLP